MASMRQGLARRPQTHKVHADCTEAAFSQGLAVLNVPPPDPENLGLETEVKGGGEEGQRGRKSFSRQEQGHPSAAAFHTLLSMTPLAPKVHSFL